MDTSIVPILALMTFLAVLIFALVSKKKTDDRRHDPNAPTSSLAKDGEEGGVAFLKPAEEQGRDAETVGDPRPQTPPR